uniref:WAP domain-containing protein n=1 Tax=Strix occidentalis caurina TaxID=311401 RepID=A0A8D0L0H0_STROC
APSHPSDKPGECPKVRPCGCAEECEADWQCPGGQRCTGTGCGRVCRDIPGGESQPGPRGCAGPPQGALPWGAPQPGAPQPGACLAGRVGVCPILRELDAAAVPPHGAERCPEGCEADSQCPWGQTCTRTSCGRVCTDTPGGREGPCPVPRGRGTCLELCSFDEECPWGHKCCSNGCGRVCVRVPGGKGVQGTRASTGTQEVPARPT